ncbi:hypothetical protein Rs2_38528 [Raphanus sativus]|nr:hypothetical protein Rs2_38528 [Raphanus sativus]
MGTSVDGKSGEGMRKRLKISVPHFDNSALVKTFSKTVIGRCMNPVEQDMKALLGNLPKIWKLEDKVTGRDLGMGKFQFDFQTEEDMEGVLKLLPFHFDYWMLSLAKWQAQRPPSFPSDIVFWVRVRGVPAQFRTEPALRSIGDAIGRTVAVDVDQIRVQVVLDGFEPLCFETSVDFKGGEFYDGEEVTIALKYEKLFGYCETCGRLCHKEEKCPLGKKSDVQGSGEAKAQKEEREGNGGWHDVGKHDERARSFKGVLLNGKGNQQYKVKDSREYYSKGKGKMYGDSEAKWAKTGEKGNKRGYNNGGAPRGEDDGFRYKSNRKEDMRSGGNKGRSEYTKSQTSEVQFQQGSSKEVREEGEIVGNEEHKELLPSEEFQKALVATQADGAVAVSDPVDEVNGTHMMESMLEKQVNLSDDETMTYGEIRDHLMAHGIDVDAVELGEEETEMDLEDLMQPPWPEYAVIDAGNQSKMVEGQEESTQDAEKKQGAKKKLFKPSTSTAGSNKMRIATALVSPRKRAPPKQGNRHPENAKQAESKGASLPKSGQMN